MLTCSRGKGPLRTLSLDLGSHCPGLSPKPCRLSKALLYALRNLNKMSKTWFLLLRSLWSHSASTLQIPTGFNFNKVKNSFLKLWGGGIHSSWEWGRFSECQPRAGKFNNSLLFSVSLGCLLIFCTSHLHYYLFIQMVKHLMIKILGQNSYLGEREVGKAGKLKRRETVINEILACSFLF